MSDYIKREDAVRRIAVLMAAEAESDGCEDQPMDNYIEYASEDLADIPSADVAPVRRGYWLPMVAENKMTKDIRGARACSNCGSSYFSYYDVPDIEDVVPNYCPNCGAKMDEGEDNA